jgi:hypothetical protein
MAMQKDNGDGGGSSFFDKLPREIRDKIYLAAFGDGEVLKVTPLMIPVAAKGESWYFSQSTHEMSSSVTPKYSGELSYRDLLVSKQFFTEAVTRMIRGNWINAEPGSWIFEGVSPSTLLGRNLTSYIFTFCAWAGPEKMADRSHRRLAIVALSSCTLLANLIVKVEAWDEPSRFVYVRYIGAAWVTMADKSCLAALRDFKNLKGLKTFDIVLSSEPVRRREGMTVAKGTQAFGLPLVSIEMLLPHWGGGPRRSLQSLEEEIRQSVTQPKATS